MQCTGVAEATQARQRLEAAGVDVDTLGAVRFTSTAAAEYEAGPWARDTPTTQLGSLSLQPQASQEDVQPGGLLSRLPRRFASRISQRRLAQAKNKSSAGTQWAPRSSNVSFANRGQPECARTDCSPPLLLTISAPAGPKWISKGQSSN